MGPLLEGRGKGGGRRRWQPPRPLGIVLSREVPQIPPTNTPITADQHSTLVEEASIETHHKGSTGNIDGRASRDAKHSEPPAYKGQLLRILLRVEGDFVGACSRGAGRRIG